MEAKKNLLHNTQNLGNDIKTLTGFTEKNI